tara:strand:- start:2578 stop:3129 length:552 start_codon:yes stop_codon:yes gene_type:complete
MAKTNLKFKRVIRRYEYLIEELEDTHEMHSEATIAFNKALAKSEEKEYYAPKNEEEEEEDFEKIEMAKEYKKLFRKIVIKCHPDKIDKSLSELEQAELREWYEIAVEAHEIGEPTPLIVIAVKLDIDVSEFEKDVDVIEEYCDNIEKGIQQIQNTSAWYYTHILKTEEEKQEFIKKFIEVTKK